MEQLCKRTGNKLEFCPEMENEIERGDLFENVSLDVDRHLVLLRSEIYINYCPFCGGKLEEDKSVWT